MKQKHKQFDNREKIDARWRKDPRVDGTQTRTIADFSQTPFLWGVCSHIFSSSPSLLMIHGATKFNVYT